MHTYVPPGALSRPPRGRLVRGPWLRLRADRVGELDVADDAVAEEASMPLPCVRSKNWSAMTMWPGLISSFMLPTAETEMIRSTPSFFMP